MAHDEIVVLASEKAVAQVYGTKDGWQRMALIPAGHAKDTRLPARSARVEVVRMGVWHLINRLGEAVVRIRESDSGGDFRAPRLARCRCHGGHGVRHHHRMQV